METIRGCWRSVADFCARVVEWRSAATVPYILLVNVGFWCTVFYTDDEVQMKALAALAISVFATDLLFSPTHERSIIVQVLLWPIKDLWKTASVLFSGLGIHFLAEKQEEPALWSSVGAVACLLLSPVYYYNDVNGKIKHGFLNIGSLFKQLLTYCIVRPILYVYEGIKFVVLLKWISGLRKRLGQLGAYLYAALDRTILQRLRAFGHRTMEIVRYWLYFHWLSDLKTVLKRWVGDPVVERLRVVRSYFVYVFGGYWFAPLLRHCGRLSLDISRYLMGVANQCAVAVGNSVVWPLIVFTYEQLKEVGLVVYDVAGKPVVRAVHKKYKMAEDLAFIYLLGPTAKTIIEVVPEKNPFCDDTDDDLKEFIPGPVGEETESEESESEDELAVPQIPRANDSKTLDATFSTVDDLDDTSFLVQRLNRELSISDSSDEEFLLFPKKEKPRRRRTATDKS